MPGVAARVQELRNIFDLARKGPLKSVIESISLHWALQVQVLTKTQNSHRSSHFIIFLVDGYAVGVNLILKFVGFSLKNTATSTLERLKLAERIEDGLYLQDPSSLASSLGSYQSLSAFLQQTEPMRHRP